MKSKKRKKIIVSIVLVICIFIGELFYFSDPLEQFNDFDIPENPNDIVLCYFQADLGSTNRQYYIITRNGTVKMYVPNHSTDYNQLLEFNETEAEGVQIEPLTDKQLGYLKKMNPDNYRVVSKTYPTDIAYPESIYYIIQKSGEAYGMKSIWNIYYKGSIGENPQSIEKCRSKYTNKICDYIDYAVSEAKKAGFGK